MKCLLLVFSILFSVRPHPLHVSVTEISFDEKEAELEIMMRIFVDDLETCVREQTGNATLDITKPQKGTIKGLIEAYIKDKFAVKLDGTPQKLQYLGQEQDGQAFVCYILVSDVKPWHKIDVTNSVIQEVFDDQSNLVHVTLGGTVHSMRLTADKPSGTIDFQNH